MVNQFFFASDQFRNDQEFKVHSSFSYCELFILENFQLLTWSETILELLASHSELYESGSLLCVQTFDQMA